MSEQTIYRADHPGSYIRPDYLRQARIDRTNGRIAPAQLREVEDRAILDVLEMQRQVGVDVFSDGEFRRRFFFSSLEHSLEGVEEQGPDYERTPRLREIAPEAVAEFAIPNPAVVGKLRPKGRFTADEVAFLKQHSPGPFKITIPSATRAHPWYKPGVTDRFYPTLADFDREIIDIMAAEVRALVADGVPYIQIDAPGYTRFMVPERRAQMADSGKEFEDQVAAENELLSAAKADGVTRAIHICLGTYILGDPTPGGGFDPVGYDADWTGRLFEALDADVFQVEYTGRAKDGALQALSRVPQDKVVALGLINVRDPQLESQDELLRNIEEASHYFPIENLSLIANCGFAGNNAGAFMSEDMQRRKLELLVDTARKVWN